MSWQRRIGTLRPAEGLFHNRFDDIQDPCKQVMRRLSSKGA